MSNQYQAEGRVIVVGEPATYGKLRKREFVLEIEGWKQPETVQFQVTGDRIDKYDIAVGDFLRVDFNLRGRDWTKPDTGEVKYFNSLDVWRMENLDKVAASAGGGEQPAQDFGEDDLPF